MQYPQLSRVGTLGDPGEVVYLEERYCEECYKQLNEI